MVFIKKEKPIGRNAIFFIRCNGTGILQHEKNVPYLRIGYHVPGTVPVRYGTGSLQFHWLRVIKTPVAMVDSVTYSTHLRL